MGTAVVKDEIDHRPQNTAKITYSGINGIVTNYFINEHCIKNKMTRIYEYLVMNYYI